MYICDAKGMQKFFKVLWENKEQENVLIFFTESCYEEVGHERAALATQITEWLLNLNLTDTVSRVFTIWFQTQGLIIETMLLMLEMSQFFFF